MDLHNGTGLHPRIWTACISQYRKRGRRAVYHAALGIELRRSIISPMYQGQVIFPNQACRPNTTSIRVSALPSPSYRALPLVLYPLHQLPEGMELGVGCSACHSWLGGTVRITAGRSLEILSRCRSCHRPDACSTLASYLGMCKFHARPIPLY